MSLVDVDELVKCLADHVFILVVTGRVVHTVAVLGHSVLNKLLVVHSQQTEPEFRHLVSVVEGDPHRRGGHC